MVQKRGREDFKGGQVKPIILLCVVFLLTVVFAESAVDFCDSSVAAQLEDKGLHAGYNEEFGEFVVIAHAQTRCADPSVDMSVWAFCRDVFLKAHAKARREIANMVKGSLEASNALIKMSVDDERIRARTAAIAMTADELPSGVIMLAVEGVWRDGIYAASVAMAWSEKWDGRTRDSLAGVIVPAADWKAQLHRAVEMTRVELLPPCGEFVDSNGFAHFFGADVSDVLSCPERGRGAALMSMEKRALSRLQLAYDGSGAAALGMHISTQSKGDAEMALKTAAGGIGSAASSSMPRNVCVFEGNVVSETFKRSLYAIVYAADCTKPSETKRKKVNSSSSASPNVMIFNPNTGKFEKQ